MNLTHFGSIRGRLLALMLFILVPVAILSIVLATTTYRSVSRAIELSEIEVASNYAVRTRVWFRGALRMAMATAVAARSAGLGSNACVAMLQDVTAALPGVEAASFDLGNGERCRHSILPRVDDAALDRIMADQQSKAPISMWAGPELGRARYDAVRVDGHLHLLIHAWLPPVDGRSANLLVLMDPQLLDLAFQIGALDSGSIVALMSRGRNVLVTRGVDENDRSWLPEQEVITDDVTRVLATDGTGERYSYAAQRVSEPDIYILARFDNAPSEAAFFQFLVLSLTPLLTLVVLFVAYAMAIQNDVLRWVQMIEQTARARLTGGFKRVDVNPAMPSDLLQVADAYNTLVGDVEQREGELRTALATNMHLMRELNHRVKNSLQVIQSYLALSRRQARQDMVPTLLETEAKVLVLSTAYRLALREGVLQSVPVREFVEEVVANLSTYLRRSDQWIDLSIAEGLFPLVVDRAIPLGLALVESVSAALRADGRSIRIELTPQPAEGQLNGGGDGMSEGVVRAQLRVTCESSLPPNTPPQRIMAGLAAQIGAEAGKPEPGEVLRWTMTR